MIQPVDETIDHVRGPATGHVIVEYGDCECPYSRRAFREIRRRGAYDADRLLAVWADVMAAGCDKKLAPAAADPSGSRRIRPRP
jgi:hypothetical protein